MFPYGKVSSLATLIPVGEPEIPPAMEPNQVTGFAPSGLDGPAESWLTMTFQTRPETWTCRMNPGQVSESQDCISFLSLLGGCCQSLNLESCKEKE